MTWPHRYHPKARIMEQGAQYLNDAELLSILLQSTTDKCGALLLHYGSLRKLLSADPQELLKLHGLSEYKLANLRALAGLSSRIASEELTPGNFIGSHRDAAHSLAHRMRDLPRETFAVIFLDTRHRIIATEEMFTGTINSSMVAPREVVKRALQLNATAILIAHNHPSGNATPSANDRQVTREVKTACNLMEIELLDHVIFGANETFSLQSNGLMP